VLVAKPKQENRNYQKQQFIAVYAPSTADSAPHVQNGFRSRTLSAWQKDCLEYIRKMLFPGSLGVRIVE